MYHLLSIAIVFWTVLDKLLLEISFTSDSMDMASISKQSLWYMPYCYIFQILYASSYAAS